MVGSFDVNADDPLLADCVSTLVREFPVEDVWLLERSQASECGLDCELNLIVVASPEAEAHTLEPAVRQRAAALDPSGSLAVFVFPHTVIDRLPRPLLVKMALSSGRSLYRG